MTINIYFTYFFIFFLFGVGVFIKQKNTNYRILGLLYLTVSYQSLIFYFLKTNIIITYPHLFRTALPFQFLQGPILYFFVLYTIKSNRAWKVLDLLHLIPFLLVVLDLLPFYSLSGEEKIASLRSLTFENYFSFSSGLMTIKQHGTVRSLIFLLYIYTCFMLIYPLYKNKDSSLNKKNELLLSWLMFYLTINVVFFIILLFFVFSSSFQETYLSGITNFLIGLELLINIIFIFFNPKLISGISWFSDAKETNNTIKSSRNSMKNKRDEVIFEQLQLLMEKEEVFKNKIEINEIAKQLNISSIKLSSMIKMKYNQSFTDFVNSYRLLHFDKQINENKHLMYSFEHMAYESGFSSKNSFYAAFKKSRHVTPKVYYNVDSQK